MTRPSHYHGYRSCHLKERNIAAPYATIQREIRRRVAGLIGTQLPPAHAARYLLLLRSMHYTFVFNFDLLARTKSNGCVSFAAPHTFACPTVLLPDYPKISFALRRKSGARGFFSCTSVHMDRDTNLDSSSRVLCTKHVWDANQETLSVG